MLDAIAQERTLVGCIGEHGHHACAVDSKPGKQVFRTVGHEDAGGIAGRQTKTQQTRGDRADLGVKALVREGCSQKLERDVLRTVTGPGSQETRRRPAAQVIRFILVHFAQSHWRTRACSMRTR